ncbi:hypothetical protein HS1genome_0891 [Sulfodiicoccus acidiphilus]|uniref:Uncharacterized protein n=1 Tax=Sulfodiicoccus acidiphilus TaxID=1670455 RepID=A0A348B2V0_9CREN|nr:hypothetical protein [Sulfodiicoccus acidiphilus]BBD72502.1 hypothetical protein HS1genome_0891 [Sulfodiicoccus acidiphilus]GGT94080.1 hypothetical protein GCM10007116_09780 [Sulfodiicoccus acidiphilus]
MSSAQPGASKSKELKIVKKQVINPTVVNEDRRKARLLFVIKQIAPVSEKGLLSLLSLLKEKGIDVEYQFTTLPNGSLISPQFKEDLTSLLYLELLESDPRDKRLKLSSQGEDTIATIAIDDEFKSKVLPAIDELRPKVQAIDQELNLKMRAERRRNRR